MFNWKCSTSHRSVAVAIHVIRWTVPATGVQWQRIERDSLIHSLIHKRAAHTRVGAPCAYKLNIILCLTLLPSKFAVWNDPDAAKPQSVFVNYFPNYLTDWLSDWLTDSLTDRPTDWPTDRLTDWATYWPTDRETDCLRDWPTDRLTDWLSDWLTDRNWLSERLTDRQTDWLTCYLHAAELNLSSHSAITERSLPYSHKLDTNAYSETFMPSPQLRAYLDILCHSTV